VFLLNSRYPLLSATADAPGREVHNISRHTFFRSYGVSLLSSLTTILTSALVCSTRHLSRLWYGHQIISLRGFSREHGLSHFARPDGIARHHLSALNEAADLPTASAYGLHRDFQRPDDLPFSVTHRSNDQLVVQEY